MARLPQGQSNGGYSVGLVPSLWNLRNWTGDEWRLWLKQFGMLLLGLFFFASALMLSLYSNLGANSWTVFHDGIAKQSPLTLGQASQVVGIIMILVSWLVGIRPGLGTVLNMFLVGVFMDLIIWSGWIEAAETLPRQVAFLVLSILGLGLASGMYIKAGFGAGPRDSFNLAIIELTNWSITVSRWTMEASVVVIGILLGGQFGIGTILFAMFIGPSVGLGFRVFGLTRRPKVEPRPASTS